MADMSRWGRKIYWNRCGVAAGLFDFHAKRVLIPRRAGRHFARERGRWMLGPATLKYRLEDEMISEYVAQKQREGDARPMQEIAVEYNDTVIYPDKVRLNCYYYRHYSFIKDMQMILCTVLGKKMEYGGEVI